MSLLERLPHPFRRCPLSPAMLAMQELGEQLEVEATLSLLAKFKPNPTEKFPVLVLMGGLPMDEIIESMNTSPPREY